MLNNKPLLRDGGIRLKLSTCIFKCSYISSILSLVFELKGLFIVDIDNTKSIKRNNCVPVVMRLLSGDVEVGGDVSLQ